MKPVLILIVLAMLVAACGDGAVSDEPQGSDGGAGSLDIPVEDSCLLADAQMVQEAFGGEVSAGVEDSSYACKFEITGGPVEDVQVREAGPASSFEAVRSGYHDNFEGTFDVPGIGDEAFYPGIQGPLLLVVSASGQVFSVSASDAFAEVPAGTEDMVAELARAIVERLEG